VLHRSGGDASRNALRVGSAATHKAWQKQPLPLRVVCLWLVTGCEEEEKGLSVGQV